VVLASWLAGFAAFTGGLFAHLERSAESSGKDELVHGVIAFGGGVLVSAVAFALAPEGMAYLHPAVVAALFAAGGIVFCLIDARLARAGGSRAQFLAMLMDFVPEAISMGAVFGHDRRLGVLLAIFIGAQNLPEGFNAFREMISSGNKPRTTLLVLLLVSLLGPAAAVAGHYLLKDLKSVTAAIMTFAAGGILYLIFQDIAPQARLRRHWGPSLAAVGGFLLGMIGRQLLG
jgi:ZIP family zinc transporter